MFARIPPIDRYLLVASATSFAVFWGLLPAFLWLAPSATAFDGIVGVAFSVWLWGVLCVPASFCALAWAAALVRQLVSPEGARETPTVAGYAWRMFLINAVILGAITASLDAIAQWAFHGYGPDAPHHVKSSK